MATNHIPQLVEALQRGRLALFVGGDLPQGATGLPSRADLAAGLAERLGLAAPTPPWPEIAARYEASAGLNALITWLRDQLEPAGQEPGPVHGLLAQLPVTTYLTTAYDTRLHDALREAGRRPNLPVVDASSLGLLDANRPTVVHLFGTYDRPGSLVLTAAHLQQLPQSKAQILAGLVHPTLANQNVLILGQDLRDIHFQALYQTALFQAGTIRPSAYAAWPGLEEWEVQTWRGQEVRVLDLPAVELLQRLLGTSAPEASDLGEQSRQRQEQGRSLADVLRIKVADDGKADVIKGGQWFVRLVVESQEPITQCEGWIHHIEPTPDGFERSILSWKPSHFGPRLLEPSEPQEIDIAWRAHHDPPFPSDELRIASAKEYGERNRVHWNRTQDFIPLRPGSYLLTVRFHAEGYDDTVTRTYRLDWPGPNQEDSIRLVEPNKVPVPRPAPPEIPSEVPVRPSEAPQFERLHIDPKDVPYAAIRELLEAAFTPETLRRFCQDRPAFEPLLRRFSPADGVSDMVDEVLEYCRTELLWDDLLAEVAQAKPGQYTRFERDLRGQAYTPPSTGGERRPVDAAVSSQAQVALPPDPGAGPEPRPPADRAPQTLTWLHLSDLHFREEEAYDANIVLRALLRDVGERIQEDGLRPDWIVVTGDIAFASRPDEYDLARQFFDDLMEVTGLGKDRLFVVPGNHDVDRKAITTLAAGATSILNNRRAVNRFLADDTERALVFQRFHHYGDFINEYLGPSLAFDTASYFYVQQLEVAGRSVAVLGLNSAWLAASDRDRHQLLLGERQVRSALEAAQDADLRLAVMHHPFDWLQDFDRNDAEPLLCGGCDFVLHGHMHDVGLLQARDPDSEAFIIAAGACYDTREHPDRPNAYNFVRLNPVAGEGRVHLRMYSDRQGGFWTKDVFNYRNVRDGVYRFALPSGPGAR